MPNSIKLWLLTKLTFRIDRKKKKKKGIEEVKIDDISIPHTRPSLHRE